MSTSDANGVRAPHRGHLLRAVADQPHPVAQVPQRRERLDRAWARRQRAAHVLEPYLHGGPEAACVRLDP